MGEVKEEMATKKRTTEDLSLKDKVKDALTGLVGKRSNGDPGEAAKTFADHILEADTKLDSLIKVKKADLARETGDERYNTMALAKLETMKMFLDEIANLSEQYGQLRK